MRFSSLMSAQAQLQARNKLPSKHQQHNNKDALFNAIVDMLETKQLFLFAYECQSFGKNLVSLLTEVLWCIDGHHDTFNKQSLHYLICSKFFLATTDLSVLSIGTELLPTYLALI